MRFDRPLQEVLTYILRSKYKIDFVPHHSAWSVHIFHSSFEGIDSDKIYGGTGRSKEVAIAKAVSEFVERNALNEEAEKTCLIDSTGFAARPLAVFSSLTKLKTRSSAMLEAMERFYAFHWWEDQSIGHSLITIDGKKSPLFLGLGISELFCRILQIQVFTPGIEDVLVLVGMLPEQGFVVGCAAGWAWERHDTLFRAAVELMRHYHIVEKSRENSVEPSSSYSQKLLYLASGNSDQGLKDRLKSVGVKKCHQPRVLFDGEISHRFDKLYYVHRFCFEDQPDILSTNSNIII